MFIIASQIATFYLSDKELDNTLDELEKTSNEIKKIQVKKIEALTELEEEYDKLQQPYIKKQCRSRRSKVAAFKVAR